MEVRLTLRSRTGCPGASSFPGTRRSMNTPMAARRQPAHRSGTTDRTVGRTAVSPCGGAAPRVGARNVDIKRKLARRLLPSTRIRPVASCPALPRLAACGSGRITPKSTSAWTHDRPIGCIPAKTGRIFLKCSILRLLCASPGLGVRQEQSTTFGGTARYGKMSRGVYLRYENKLAASPSLEHTTLRPTSY